MKKQSLALLVSIFIILAFGAVVIWYNVWGAPDDNFEISDDFVATEFESSHSSPSPIQEQMQGVVVNEWTDLIKYNCELSDGRFEDGRCKCPVEEELAEVGGMAYDKSTGYCQTAHGGPGGDAFNASVGLPWGDFSFWIGIVGNHCSESGGTWLNARCTCPGGTTYDRSSGICK